MVRREEQKIVEAPVSVVEDVKEDVKEVVIETANAATAQLDCSGCSSGGSMLKLVAGAGAGLVLVMGFIMILVATTTPATPTPATPEQSIPSSCAPFNTTGVRVSVSAGSKPCNTFSYNTTYHTCNDLTRYYESKGCNIACGPTLIQYSSLTTVRGNDWLKREYPNNNFGSYTEYNNECCSVRYDEICPIGAHTRTLYTSMGCSGTPNEFTQYIGNPQVARQLANGTYVTELNTSVGKVGGEFYYTCI